MGAPAATTFLFFGLLSLDFLFHMYFLVRYCRLLEEGEFRGRTADFLVMVGFGVAVGVAGASSSLRSTMLVTAVLMLAVGGAADMASAAFRTSMLQTVATDEMRGRLQGIFIVVVAGGPRVADVAHGASAALIGTSAAAAGGGVLVVVGVVVAALAVPSFVRYRVTRATPAS